MFVHKNRIDGVTTRMVSDFAGLQEQINKFEAKTFKKAPDSIPIMVFYNASNVSEDGKACCAHGVETPTYIMMARYAFIDVKSEPLYLVDKMETISMDAHTYTKMSCHLATDAKDERVFWSQSLGIITDQSLIDKLEWNNIT